MTMLHVHASKTGTRYVASRTLLAILRLKKAHASLVGAEIAFQVPLGNNRRVPNMEMLSKGHWTPLQALHEADRIIKEQDPVR